VAVVRTAEQLNIPRFLIARWNLTVDMAYNGLLWVGALQVDPGWVGYLPCPLYNMSNSEVVLKPGDRLFTIDFVRTTPFNRAQCLSYSRKAPVNPPMASFLRGVLQSGPYEALGQLKELAEFRAFAGGLFAVGFAALGAVVTALGVLVTRPLGEVEWVGPQRFSFWPTVALSWSAIAVVLGAFAVAVSFYRFRTKR
jgi:hypothetical protein